MKTTVVVLAIVMACAATAAQQPVDTSPHSERHLEVNGIMLHCVDWGGNGEPLVFLTGYGAAAHVFDAIAPRFTDSFHVLALTRRGRAPSQTPASGYDLDTLTADVMGALDALKFGRVHIVAHSFGGSEATQLATLYPERVASVVYLDAALDAAAGEAVMKESPIPNPQPPPGSPYAQVLQWWTSYTPDFSRLRSPALAFFALQDDPPIPQDASDEVRRRAYDYWRTRWLPTANQMIDKFRRESPQSRVVVLRNASHYLFRDREAEVVRDMREFYGAIRR
jgi:pimeloyl-ACP methyl ester carboxylesterase